MTVIYSNKPELLAAILSARQRLIDAEDKEPRNSFKVDNARFNYQALFYHNSSTIINALSAGDN